MICPVCKIRWAPRRIDHWRPGWGDEPIAVAVTPNAEEVWERDFNDDHLVPCRKCILN